MDKHWNIAGQFVWFVELAENGLCSRTGSSRCHSGFHGLDGEQAAKLEVLDDGKLL